MSITSIVLTSVAGFSFICILAVLFFERKNPASSLVWVLVLLFLPVAGFVFYLFLGSGFRVTRRKKYELKAISDDIYNNFITKHLNLGHTKAYMQQHAECSHVLSYLKNQPDGVYTDNNNAKIHIDGESMFRNLLEDIRNAKRHIHILFYIFRNDVIGKEILAALAQKAAEGIEVRFLYDSVGTMMAFDTPFRSLKKAGGQVRAFAPLFSSLSSHIRLNYRNHRKIVVIDGLIGYVGGMNVGDEYRGLHKTLKPWRDTHLRITGSAVWFLQERFFMDWAYSSDTDPHKVDISTYFPEPMQEDTLGMQIISSGPDTFESPIKSGMLSMIYSARKSIHIQTPYFCPDVSFLDALRIAANSNVDVHLMIPLFADYDIVQRATFGYVREMLEGGVNVYMYNGFIHAKTMVIDTGVATIGTTNLTNRSFTLDFEVNAFVYGKQFAEQCEHIFLDDVKNSIRMEKNYFEHRSMWERGSYNFARMFAPLM